MFESVLVANRGEIARRVIRTLRRLGIRSIAVHSDADREAPFVREADVVVRIGPAPAGESYLAIDRILEAAARTGAQAVHPGYGFLSERPDFARACAGAGIVFVGPGPEAMEALGDKLRAKELARAAGVPTVPTYSVEEARGTTDYPLLVKAAAGGGGRGMRVVAGAEELDAALAAAQREAAAGFGDGRVFIERYLPRARHIEVQLLADHHGSVIHLGERECSLQRRHQKVLEEAPSPVVSPELREQLGAEAVALGHVAGYRNAGTVEFIADADDPATHFFLEMNARIQVEHPVTELVTGLDLIELQLRVAAGEPLPLTQDDVALNGHAIEVRINAEAPARGFLPSSGRVLAYRRPSGARVDDGIDAGSEVGTDYDSMLGKLIVHAADRPAALERLRRALASTAILGLRTNVAFLARLAAHESIQRGEVTTALLEQLDLADDDTAHGDVAAVGALVTAALDAEAAGDDPFDRTDGWRLGGVRAWVYSEVVVDDGERVAVRLRQDGDATRVALDADEREARVRRVGPGTFAITLDGRRADWDYARDGDALWLAHGGAAHRLAHPPVDAAADAAQNGVLRAPMPGAVLTVLAEVGRAVGAGDPLVVMESMKMELTIAATGDGVVTALWVAPGDRVGVDQPLAQVDAV